MFEDINLKIIWEVDFFLAIV